MLEAFKLPIAPAYNADAVPATDDSKSASSCWPVLFSDSFCFVIWLSWFATTAWWESTVSYDFEVTGILSSYAYSYIYFCAASLFFLSEDWDEAFADFAFLSFLLYSEF